MAALSDPTLCGEDMPEILRWLLDHAEEACDGCEYYHVGFLAQRFTPGGVAVEKERPQFIGALKRAVADAPRTTPRLRIAIAGAGDTGVCASVAHAASAMLGVDGFGIDVWDRCATPGAACARFGAAHGVAIEGRVADFEAPLPAPGAPYDLIVMHSVLRHVAPASRPALMAGLANWLAPGGLILNSQTLVDPAELSEWMGARRGYRGAAIDVIMADGRFGEGDRARLLSLMKELSEDQPKTRDVALLEEVVEWMRADALALADAREIEVVSHKPRRHVRRRALVTMRRV